MKGRSINKRFSQREAIIVLRFRDELGLDTFNL